MRSKPLDHPITRIREALGNLPEDSGFRESSSIRGFARLIGCSESALRKVESGKVSLSSKLAELIERKIGVSARWLMEPSEDGRIRRARGGIWRAEDLNLFTYLPALKPMLIGCPSVIPRAIGKMVEILLAEDFEKGDPESLVRVIRLLQRAQFFEKEDPDRGIESRVRSASFRPDEELPPLLLDSLFLLADSAKEEPRGFLSHRYVSLLDYLKSVEPPIQDDSEIARVLPILQKWERGRSRPRTHQRPVPEDDDSSA